MTRSPVANQTLAILAALFSLAVLTVVPSHAQTQDFEIMVSGPWQFVVAADSMGHDRLFLVAPYDVTHIANFWSGTNASMQYWMDKAGDPDGELVIFPNGTDPTSNYQKNVYALDFSGYTHQKIPAPHRKHELVYQTTSRISPSTIQKVLFPTDTSITRYAISLPDPDYVRTYSGKFGPGTAEAEIGNAIGEGSVAPAQYATWTVLHYGLTPATATSSSSVSVTGGQNAGPILFGDADDYNRYGISIALVEAPWCDDNSGNYYKGYGVIGGCRFPALPNLTDDRECDSLSGLSFSLSAKLWGLNEYALFPSEKDALGNQNSGSYDYECGPYNAKNTDAAIAQQQRAATHNRAAAEKIEAVARTISTLENLPRFSLQPNALVPGRSEKKQDEDSNLLLKDFTKIFKELNFLFPSGVPASVAAAYYCVCEAAHLAVDAKNSQCTKFGPYTCTGTPRSDLKIILEALDTADKGSSDCHSPQISIDGAIQPQP